MSPPHLLNVVWREINLLQTGNIGQLLKYPGKVNFQEVTYEDIAENRRFF